MHFSGSLPLTIELVPRSAWYKNVRSNVTSKEWDFLKNNCYAKAGHVCEICQGTGKKWPVECHEIWEYNDEDKIQKLIKLIALCPACHEVKHMGLAGLKGRADIAIKHLAKVNNWSMDVAKEYVNLQFIIWNSRSNDEWKLDISILDNLLKENIEKETW